jgi:hypothetical protein
VRRNHEDDDDEDDDYEDDENHDADNDAPRTFVFGVLRLHLCVKFQSMNYVWIPTTIYVWIPTNFCFWSPKTSSMCEINTNHFFF